MSATTLLQRYPEPTAVLMDSGPLGRAGGVTVFDGLPPSPMFDALAQEAFDAYAFATRPTEQQPGTGPARARTPYRQLANGQGGPVQDALYAAEWLRDFISEQVGVPVVPSGTRGSYSYYVEPGDHLDLHVDVYDCDITLITVLYDDTPPSSSAGGVAFHLDRVGDPLDSIDTTSDSEATIVKPRPGQSVLLLGGLVPHRVIPIVTGRRIISPLCFRAVLP